MNCNQQPIINQGWVCSKCGHVNSSTTPTCPCYFQGKMNSYKEGGE